MRSFFLHPQDGGTIVVLTTDGQLHLVDGESGQIVGSRQVVPDFGVTGTRPSLTVGQRGAYVSDPRDGRVTEVALPDLQITARILVGGQPSSIAVVHR